jgi:hypothetical protein
MKLARILRKVLRYSGTEVIGSGEDQMAYIMIIEKE